MLAGLLAKYPSQLRADFQRFYGLNLDGNKDIDQLLRESDAMMYSDKDKYYEETGINRRHI